MSLVTCGRFFRPCLSRVRPALSSPGRAGFRLYSSFEKRPNVAVNRVFTRPASGSSQSSAGGLMGDNGMLIVGIGLLGGSLLYVSIFLKFLDGDSKSRICLHNCSFFLLWGSPASYARFGHEHPFCGRGGLGCLCTTVHDIEFKLKPCTLSLSKAVFIWEFVIVVVVFLYLHEFLKLYYESKRGHFSK